jgi:hypothetical protein
MENILQNLLSFAIEQVRFAGILFIGENAMNYNHEKMG